MEDEDCKAKNTKKRELKMDTNNVYSRKYHECKRAGCSKEQARPVTLIQWQSDWIGISHMAISFQILFCFAPIICFFASGSFAGSWSCAEDGAIGWPCCAHWVCVRPLSFQRTTEYARGMAFEMLKKKLADAPRKVHSDLTWHVGHEFQFWTCLNQ